MVMDHRGPEYKAKIAEKGLQNLAAEDQQGNRHVFGQQTKAHYRKPAYWWNDEFTELRTECHKRCRKHQ